MFMKKLISILMVLVLLFVMCSCSNNKHSDSENIDNNIVETTDGDTNKNNSINNSETTDSTENTETESAESTEDVKDGDSDKTVGDKKDITNQNTENKKPTTNKTEDKKPSITEKPNQTTETPETKPNNKEDNKTPSQNTTDNNVGSSKPYYVGFELVGIERKYTKVCVDGLNIIDKVYGKNRMLQNGDVVTYKIIMSDGGNTGFSLTKSPLFGEYVGHSATVEGNLIKVTANGSGSEVDVYIKVDAENGRQKTINLGCFKQMSYTEDISKNEVLIENVLKDYGRNLGMEYVDGFSIGNNNNVFVDIPNNSDWLLEAIHSIEKWYKDGMKRFFIVVNFYEAFSGVAD